MKRPFRHRGETDTALMAGWLFADVLLALVVIFLGAEIPLPSAGAEENASTTTTTTAPPGIEQKPHTLELDVNRQALQSDEQARAAEITRLQGEVRRELKRLGISERRVGMVLSFGHSRSRDDGQQFADQFNKLILASLPETFESAAFRKFFWDDNHSGRIHADLYLFR